MILSIISIVVNILFIVVLKLDLYTDKIPMPDGDVRTWRGSPADRLDAASKSGLFYLQIFLAAVSVITSILIICGVKNNVVKIIQIASLIASAVLFIVIMVIAQTTHPKY